MLTDKRFGKSQRTTRPPPGIRDQAIYSGRLNPLDPDYQYVEELRANDLDNARGTRSLREIRYTVKGPEGGYGGRGQ